MWNQPPCNGRQYFRDYPPACKPHMRQHSSATEGPPAHFRDVVFPVGREPPRRPFEPPPGMRKTNPHAPSQEMPPSLSVHTNLANQESYAPMPEHVHQPEKMRGWSHSMIHPPAEPTAMGMQILPPFILPLPPPGLPPFWIVQPNMTKQEFAHQPPEPSEDMQVSPVHLTPPPPPAEMTSSSNSRPTTVKKERSTRAKNWIHAKAPQAPPDPPSSNTVVKLERSTSTPGSDLPSVQLPAPNALLRDPRLPKSRDSDPIGTMTAKLSRDSKANAPNKDDLEDVRKLLALGEKRRMKLEAEEAKPKQNKTSDPDVSLFKKMEAHYKEKTKAWAEKYNTLKQSYEALRQERGQQLDKQPNRLHKVKENVDEAERCINDKLEVEINRLKNELRVKNEELQRRQEATFDENPEEKKKLQRDIESYISRVADLNRENDHLLDSNVGLEARQLKLTAKLEDFRKKIDELREALADRDKTIESQKRKGAQ